MPRKTHSVHDSRSDADAASMRPRPDAAENPGFCLVDELHQWLQ